VFLSCSKFSNLYNSFWHFWPETFLYKIRSFFFLFGQKVGFDILYNRPFYFDQSTSTAIMRLVYFALLISTVLLRPFYFEVFTSTFLLRPFYFEVFTSTFLLRPFYFENFTSTFLLRRFYFDLSTSTFLLQNFYFDLFTSTFVLRLFFPIWNCFLVEMHFWEMPKFSRSLWRKIWQKVSVEVNIGVLAEVQQRSNCIQKFYFGRNVSYLLHFF